MNWGNNNKKLMALTVAGLFVLTGTYNSVVINSESHISGSDVRFVKRLDEIYGVTVPGRVVAATTSWQKLGPERKPLKKEVVVQTVNKVAAAPEVSAPVEESVAAVQEDLNLSLVEVVNPKKWQNGLPNTQFSGSLLSNNGVIEELEVALPNGEGVSVSFSEMTGNVFEYDFNGELYSGMMYQVDQHAYMVTLTNGPLEGTRLRFSSQQPALEQAQTQTALAENNNVEVGNFGEPQANPNGDYVQAEEYAQTYSPEALNQSDLEMQQQAVQAQGYNFDQAPQTM